MVKENGPFHMIVIGGGPGGYVAAIRAAQLGAEVTLVEKEHLGGTCLNIGCIPTKAMLHAAEYVNAADEAGKWGVHLKLDRIDFGQVIGQKQAVCGKLVGGVQALLRANKVRVVMGTARFTGIKTVCVKKEDGTEEILKGDRVILATGSVPVIPPIEGLRESRYMIDSTGALNLKEIPASMVVIGGGVIGVELACAYRAFGTEVTIIEALPRICPTLDWEMGDILRGELEKQGIRFFTGYKVTKVADTEEGAEVTAASESDTKVFTCGRILAALGRRPYIDGLCLDAGGVKHEKGRVQVSDELKTSVEGVYAIGDCVGRVMLAHTASAMGETAAKNAMGARKVYDPACVPSCFYTFPEIASTGLSEEQAKEKKIPYHVGRFPLSANGRALILNGGSGMIKVLVGDELNDVIGVHIVSPNASELINEANLLISMEGTVEEAALSIHAHPSVSEAFREACLASEKRAIHIVNR